MKQEIIFTGKTVEAALEEAGVKLGVEPESLNYEVLEEGSTGFLGIGATPAKIKVIRTVAGEAIAKEFIDTLLENMEIHADVEMTATRKSDRQISIVGEEAGVLIGHHGDTLEALQYLTNLAANKREEDESRDYVHITVDVENYRSKRENTLRSLARRMAAKAQRTGKSVMLEPMSAYERRIIHSEVQSIEGVSTNSVGVDDGRRVVIYLESEGFVVPARFKDGEKSGGKRSGRRGERRKSRRSEYDKHEVKKPAAPKYDDGEKMSEEELSDLISTYGTREAKENSAREPQKKFKDFDEYLNSILGSTDGEN